ncbi:hypothetical protein BAX94_04170 [Elizabethkingia meningoseptica]|uniref:Uncharacterized protein n=2 Tax=Elizabethkingia meningoseptica TaxID=238 RepID=A0A1V3TZV9_ELIME|nr:MULTISPECIES: hypothetical protein [Elizabethkingia]AQX06508.1 hypothetical protein BBD33_15125 [Elizabethkingia meningoseptica]AQX14041.1 hypothetical protein BBD35_17430 [Elizabethkingia meningoseptica]AQX48555.1 hypothetical protein B5G46_15120 [Elizabethkingia meningoseptica]KUY13608.1 hypothetical protein ATB99_13730 [Elizabethkingia meningoseptica]MBG0515861.1 hypothetical protein [Elizabethkingia meningoseptica]
MRNNTSNYNHLLGKTKKEIINILGEEFNYYPDILWIYEINRTWWGKKTVLLLSFNQEETLEKINTKTYFLKFEIKK